MPAGIFNFELPAQGEAEWLSRSYAGETTGTWSMSRPPGTGTSGWRLSAMKQGKHAAIEVPAAITLDECWQLVDTAELTRRHCLMLENCCYGEIELLVLRMARQGVFGELTHGEAGYLHESRDHFLQELQRRDWRRASSPAATAISTPLTDLVRGGVHRHPCGRPI